MKVSFIHFAGNYSHHETAKIRILVIEMVCDDYVTFLKVFIIWIRVALKDVTLALTRKWYYTNLIMTIQLS